MSVDKSVDELSHWVSTYGLITAERVLENYSLHFSREQLKEILQDANNFYHKILQCPLKNVMNGIILQQASDYQLYAQKLLIDYLITDESSGKEEGDLQSFLEEERQRLLELASQFHQKEIDHANLIAQSQNVIKKLIAELDSNDQPHSNLEVDNNLLVYKEKIDEMGVDLNGFRTQFYEFIIRVRELISSLPEYHLDSLQDSINLESLNFDPKIGSI